MVVQVEIVQVEIGAWGWGCSPNWRVVLGGGGGLFGGLDDFLSCLLGWLLGLRGSVWLFRFLFGVGSAILLIFFVFRFPSSMDSLETLLSLACLRGVSSPGYLRAARALLRSRVSL